ncbi:ankyrin repeat-containing domain protein [Staphylotrichum tortipilum]|uniref:Ankyrin repeat-containing domain protein n=1 Tax=Staphylotrichum tortipilum TaxID=2831512 RepID=A0AAN6RTS0_9PEZI|nr:ankyrin repeat-containing domain protein [Staphylotrichum longicolle]
MTSQRKTGAPRKPVAKAKTKKPDGRACRAKTKKALSVAVLVPILRLPPEIVLLIDELLELQDRLALGRANRKFHAIINPVVYRDNVRLASASSLFWGAENGQLGTLRHALAAGADLNASGPLPRKPGEAEPSTEQENDADANADPDPTAELFEEPPDPRLQPSCTPLHLAAKNGHRDIVEWLLDNGADIDAPSYRVCECQSLKSGRHPSRRLSEWPRWRALHTAMCNQERAIAELLIHRGASLELDTTPGHKHTALHSAAAHGLIPVIKLLAIDNINLDVNQRDAWDNTALHYVSEIWSARDSADIRDTITKLLALGADLEAHNESGYTPLLNACFRGNYAVAHRLVSIGANPDPHRHLPNFRDYRPLYYCMLPRSEFFDMDEAPVKHDEFEGNRVTLIKALVDAGGDVNARFDKRGHRGVTPLMLACELAEPRAVAALVQCGAEINAQDRSGRTSLCYAVTVRVDHRGEVPDIAAIMLRRGARMDIEEDPNSSPLDTAIKHIRWAEDDVLEAMLSVADKTNLTQNKLKDALRSCASCGNHKALKLLLDFASRVYEVTDADIKDYLCRIIEQSDPWNQIETFNCMMGFGRPVYTNEMLLLKTIMQQNRDLSLAVMERGVSISEPRFHGDQTYLHLACHWGDQEVVRALLERGADVNVFDRELRTPLSVAVRENYVPIAVALMKEVADPFLVPPDDLLQRLCGSGESDYDEDEWRFVKRRYLTAFDLAIRDDRVEIIQDIVSRFALPEIPPRTRCSYIHRASQNPNSAILKLLLERGADPTGGRDCPNPPTAALIRRVWNRADAPEAAVALLQTAKLLLDKCVGEQVPWVLLREIAAAGRPRKKKSADKDGARKNTKVEEEEIDDDDEETRAQRCALRDVILAELGVVIVKENEGGDAPHIGIKCGAPP